MLMAIVLMVLLAWTVSAEEGQEAETSTHEYVGVKKCKMCHKKSGIYDSWLASPHAAAWDSLSAEDQKNEELKKYYTTGTTAKGELLTGVQCEACHGAGKDYKKKSIMQDRKKAVANGLLIPDEATCKKCHHEKAPAALAAVAKDFDMAKMKTKGTHSIPAKDKTVEETKQ